MYKALLAVLAACSLNAAEWHFPLYLDGGVPHKVRREVTIRNSGGAVEGEPFRLPARELGLSGTPAKELRVVDSDGFELLYRLEPAGEIIGDTAELIVPVTAGAKGETRLWVYSGNPAAWAVPDEWNVPGSGLSDSFENGSGRLPPGWQENGTDELHCNSRSVQVAHSGSKSLETALKPGARPNWVKYYRTLPVRPGSKYTVRGWLKGENIRGGAGAGYFLHIGPAGKEHLKPVNRWGNHGTFDWKPIEFSGVIPEDADSMIVGTVMHADAGRAWFDDVEVKLESPETLSAVIGKPEKIEWRTQAAPRKWELPASEWPDRLVCSVFNTGREPAPKKLCMIPAARLTRSNFPASAYRLFLHGRELPFLLLNGTILVELPEMPARSEWQLTLYLAADRKNLVEKTVLKQASSILSDMESGSTGEVDRNRYAMLLDSPVNQLENPSFEQAGGWVSGGEKNKKAPRVTRIGQGGIFGGKTGTVDIPADVQGDWYGFRQKVAATTGRDYILTGWVNSPDGNAGIWAHEFDGKAADGSFNNFFTSVSGAGWQPFAMLIPARNKNSVIEVHLTMSRGKRHYDGIMLAEVVGVNQVKFQHSAAETHENGIAVWQVNPVVKIFPDSTPKGKGTNLNVALARNESEGLQLGIRSDKPYPKLSLTVSEPKNEAGSALPAPEVNVIGYVGIDAPSRYFQFTGIPAYRRCVPGNSRGELYPDPVIPKSEFALEPQHTQGIYIRVNAPADAEPGRYRGTIALRAGEKVLRELPYSVQVWNFTLPDRPEMSAIFDDRHGTGKQFKEYTPMEAAEFLAGKRISFDEIPAKPRFRLENGEVKADFTEFDKAARVWFEEWNIPLAYLPLFREHFGWGHPPKPFLGVQPYEGKWPYRGVDRGRFTAEYRRVCQAALKLMMEHLRRKGWQDRFILYISDEPHTSVPGIKEQMIALCDMLHEAESEVKIYASTWGYVPEWLGKLDVWGIGVQGQISEENLKKLRDSGAQLLITTDGHMCLDTPYNAIERMLPLFAWKYGTRGYEFWGADWLTRNPFKWGIHAVHTQSDVPGKPQRIRYPNGDGYIFYPGRPIGVRGPVSTVRLESLRDGIEDGSYYLLLERLANEKNDAPAKALLERAKQLAPIPNTGGRNSEKLLPDPDVLTKLRNEIGEAISRLCEVEY